jgi:adenylate kinase family enzyme
VIDRIHVLGASGSGTTTLAAETARRFGHPHLDTDDFYWQPTDPPFQRAREVPERQRLLGAALDARTRFVLSGSLVGWGDLFIPRFQLVVFLFVPHDARMERLRVRERERYGAAIQPGGALHAHHREFMDWAAAYDDAGMDMRSRTRHEAWLAALPVPVLRLEGEITTEEQIARIEAHSFG